MRKTKEQKLTPEERLEEKKRKDELHARERAARKAAYEAAKQADKVLDAACDAYEASLKQVNEDRKTLSALTVQRDKAALEVKKLAEKLQCIQQQYDAKQKAVFAAQEKVDAFEAVMTVNDKSPVELGFYRCNDAWSKLNKATIKKHRDRRVKKRAKEILK